MLFIYTNHCGSEVCKENVFLAGATAGRFLNHFVFSISLFARLLFMHERANNVHMFISPIKKQIFFFF